jgi:hypothetical protein
MHHNRGSKRESQWVPLLFDGRIDRRIKTAIVDYDGVEKITDGWCTITLSTKLDLNQPFETFDYKAWQKRMKDENPIFKTNSKTAVKNAWQHRSVPFSWETSNMYQSSMMPKVFEYMKFCATGVDPRSVVPPIHKKATKANVPKSTEQKRPGTDDALHTVSVFKKPRVELPEPVRASEGAPGPLPFWTAVSELIPPGWIDPGNGPDYKKPAAALASEAPTVDPKKPKVPDIDIQEARILFRNSALVKHLRAHKRGDWIKNPHQYIAGKETTEKTKERAADTIKIVIRDWLLTTPQGKRALAAADISEGELSIDRLIARHDKNGMGLNCIYNLYMMPVRHNSHFGDQLSPEKRAYVGQRAYNLAKGAHDAFVRDTERDYDWDEGFSKRAAFIVNEG